MHCVNMTKDRIHGRKIMLGKYADNELRQFIIVVYCGVFKDRSNAMQGGERQKKVGQVLALTLVENY